jgi:hypothetical protein
VGDREGVKVDDGIRVWVKVGIIVGVSETKMVAVLVRVCVGDRYRVGVLEAV